MVLRMSEDRLINKIMNEILKEETEQGLNGPPETKLTLLHPEDSPLYQLIAKRKQAGLDMVSKIEHRWIEDDLWPEPIVAATSTPPTRRICPKFIMCPYNACQYYKPYMTGDRLVICKNWDTKKVQMVPRAIKNGFEKYVESDDAAIYLFEVDE